MRAHGYTEPLIQGAHCQFVHPADRPRFAELGVTADISPFLWTPGVIPSAIADVLPADRASQMQPNRALIDSGPSSQAEPTGRSAPPRTFGKASRDLSRAAIRQDTTPALWPEQALTLAEAIAVFTVNGARAMGLGNVTGALAPGRPADFVILDRNPFEVDVDSLNATTVLETWFAGRQVYQADG